jgi:hypothetical protein
VHLESLRWINNQPDTENVMYLLVSQNVLGIIMPIIRRRVKSRQRLWCTALVVLQQTRGEEVVGVHLLGLVSRWWAWWWWKHVKAPISTSSFLHLVGYLSTFNIRHDWQCICGTQEICHLNWSENNLDMVGGVYVAVGMAIQAYTNNINVLCIFTAMSFKDSQRIPVITMGQ